MPATKPPRSEGARKLDEELKRVGERVPPLQADENVIGRTMFDTPGSEDLAVTVLLCQDRVQLLPSQSLVRIVCRGGKHRYLGVVTAGPFAEPDSLRADSAVLVAVATRGADYLPRFHGRVRVTILAEEQPDGTQGPPRLRPLPHSPVYLLDAKETAQMLQAEGDVRLGMAVGLDGVQVRLPSKSKAVLPRHTAILGTTGGGKSTTVANLVQQAVEAGMAVVLLDVEGEYTSLHEPTADKRMQGLLGQRGLRAGGVRAEQMGLYHLVGRDTMNPAHPGRRPFSLQFARLSPYTVAEMLALTEAQMDRYLFAYEARKGLLRDLGIFPQQGVSDEEKQRQERIALALDEFERGYPRLRLSFLLDVVGQCKALVTKAKFTPFNDALKTEAGREALCKHLNAREMPGNAASWGKLHSVLWRLHRLRVFDRDGGDGGAFLRYREMLQPGRLSVVDLSDAGLSELSNIAVADVLRGIQEEQERAYRAFDTGKAGAPTRVLLVIEEAHEFLAAERVEKTPHLFSQVARIAKRGRKRWLGLVFVTQLPGHLPRSVLGLVNNYILHKITDPHVINNLRHTAGGIDDSLWSRLPGLAPGQAIVSLGHMTRPVLVSMDPTPCKLRMVE